MGHYTGRVTEIRFDAGWQMEAFISAPAGAVPQAGEYLWASALEDPAVVIGSAIFAMSHTHEGFWAAPPIPTTWKPGTSLDLVGPFGHGFSPPAGIQRLGLAALGETTARLRPVIDRFAASQAGLTLFTDLPLPSLPASLEAYPLSSLAEALDWPDFLVFDLPLERLPGFRDVLQLPEGKNLPCPAQVLVTTSMPCAGVGQCGACAIPARRGWKLVCEDGPVFDVRQLRW